MTRASLDPMMLSNSDGPLAVFPEAPALCALTNSRIMHAYSIDSEERRIIPFALAVASVGVALGLHASVHHIAASITVPSAFAVYGLLYGLVDHLIWRWPLLRRIGVFKTPNLNGPWDCTLRSSLDDYQTTFKGTLKVTQTWTRISFYFEADDSRSHSLMAAIHHYSPTHVSVSYAYQRKPKLDVAADKQIYHGTCTFDGEIPFFDKPGQLDGEYYTDRNRSSYGSILLTPAI